MSNRCKILSLVNGCAFWPIPSTAATGAHIATQLEQSQSVVWFVSIFTMAVAVGFLVAGANSDLFGRRLCLIIGEAGFGVSLILVTVAETPLQFQVGMALSGFFSGVCQMVMCSVPYEARASIVFSLLNRKQGTIASQVSPYWSHHL